MNKPHLDFIGIGAAKSGTTWLADCLREHPQLYIPLQKEICFFDWEGSDSNYSLGFRWYNKYFKGVSKISTVGEFSTHYMYFKDSHKLIKKNYPNIKIIACIRNPADLAYSLFWWKKANYEGAKMPDTFEKALEQDSEYVERGLFYKQLKRYYDIFPKENIKVVMLDDIKQKPDMVINDICTFLNVSPNFSPSLLNKKVNKAKKPKSKLLASLVYNALELLKVVGFSRLVRQLSSMNGLSKIYTKINKEEFNYPQMKASTRKHLLKVFEDDLHNLELLLDTDLQNWMK